MAAPPCLEFLTAMAVMQNRAAGFFSQSRFQNRGQLPAAAANKDRIRGGQLGQNLRGAPMCQLQIVDSELFRLARMREQASPPHSTAHTVLWGANRANSTDTEPVPAPTSQ